MLRRPLLFALTLLPMIGKAAMPFPDDAVHKDPKIQGIVLVDASEESHLHRYEHVKGVKVENLMLLRDQKQLEDLLTKKYLGQPLSLDTLTEIKNEILHHYQSMDQSIIAVQIPEQDLTDGTVTFVVIEAQAGQVKYSGNRWVKTKFMEKFFNLKKGDPLEQGKLLNDAAWFNRNPFRATQIILSPGQEKGVSDVEFVTRDRFPVRFYGGADNTGTQFTDEARFYGGFNWGNAFNIGDILSYQFTSAPNFRRFHSHYANYTSFLPWKHQLILYGGYGEAHPKISDFHSEAKNYQMSFRYDIPFRPLYKALLQQFSFGADYKRMNSNLFFIDAADDLPVVTRMVTLTQLYACYALNYLSKVNQVTLKLEAFGSPAQFLRHQTSTDYQMLRPNSKPKYIYGRGALGDIITLPKKFAIAWLIRGQVSSNALLPSEQFGLGGYDTVRGYRERSFDADDAVCGNLELRTPPFSLFKKIRNDFYFLAFVDAAKGWNIKPEDSDLKTQNLLGSGLGVRYTALPWVVIRADYGFLLHNIPGDREFGRWHLSATVGF